MQKRSLSTQTISHKRELNIHLNSMQFYALPDPGHLANKKCLASVEKVSRRLNFPHGSPNCRTFVQESPLHLRSLDACSGVLVGWNVGLRLKALRRPAKLRMCRCSEQCFGFVSPISSQECSKPCKQNHQSCTVNGKVTANVTSLFFHSVTCLGTDQCC